MTRREWLLGAAALAGCEKSGAGYRGHAFVACAGSGSLAVVDLLAFTVRERIVLTGLPSALAAVGQRLLALVPGQEALDEIDPAGRRRVFTHKLPGPPVVVRAEANGLLWTLVNEPAPVLHPIVPEGGSPARAVRLTGRATGFTLSGQERVAAVALEQGAVELVDLAEGRRRARIELAAGLGEVRFRSDGRLLMAAERQRQQLTFLEPRSGRIVAELPLPLSPEYLAVHPDGGQVFLTGPGRDAVVVVYPYRTEIAQTSLSGRRPGRMAISLDPPYLFVSNPEANSVSVFDIDTQKVVAVTGVGVQPGRIAVTPDQQYALVLNEGSGDVAVIRISAISPGRAKRAPLFTMIPAGDAPVDVRIFPL